MLEIGMTPYQYSHCVDEAGILVSFQITFADAAGDRTLVMPRVGPELGDCTSNMFLSRDSATAARIFYSITKERVTGIGILYEDP